MADSHREVAQAKDARAPVSETDVIEVVSGLHNALSRMIEKHDPDSIEAEWLGESNELIVKLTGRDMAGHNIKESRALLAEQQSISTTTTKNEADTLRVSYSSRDAQQALQTAIPAMESGFSIHTSQGAICLHGEDAQKVMVLVGKLAQLRVNAAWRHKIFAQEGKPNFAVMPYMLGRGPERMIVISHSYEDVASQVFEDGERVGYALVEVEGRTRTPIHLEESKEAMIAAVKHQLGVELNWPDADALYFSGRKEVAREAEASQAKSQCKPSGMSCG